MSLIANITVYLTTKYNLSGLFVVNVVNIWNGSSNVASLAGAFVSDTYLGRFRTLLFGSLSSLLVSFNSISFVSSPSWVDGFVYRPHKKKKQILSNNLGTLCC